MRIEGRRVILKRDEIGSCPIRKGWAVGMIRNYGVREDFKGALAEFVRCPEVLEEAGYEVVIEEEGEKAE